MEFPGRARDQANQVLGKHPAELPRFDFAESAIERFRIEDGYTVMNLVSVCLRTVDAAIVAVLPVEGLARRVVA